jgi:hypothetical protein
MGRYIGYGEKHRRATSHLSRSHNDTLKTFLKQARGKYTLVIAGPCDTDKIGLAVETALISALNPDCNRHLGQTRYRFRPLGVPETFADRLTLAPLTKTDFLRTGSRRASVLFVRIGDRRFDDGRVGYDPVTPPSDAKILQRVDRWWHLGRHVRAWCESPEWGPTLLVGVHGAPGAQIVSAALRVDPAAWVSATRNGAGYQVPTSGPKNLDACSLRGRRIRCRSKAQVRLFLKSTVCHSRRGWQDERRVPGAPMKSLFLTATPDRSYRPACCWSGRRPTASWG